MVRPSPVVVAASTRFRSWRMAATAALVLVLVAGCASGDEGGDDAAASAGDAGFPVTIEHALGTTEITERPERVVTLGWSSQDTAIALGVTPVGMPSFPWGGDERGYLPWDLEALEGQELPVTIGESGGEVSVERIAELRPDLILAPHSGIDQATYDQLSPLAPTVAYPDEPWGTEWQEEVRLTGKALGKPEEAEQLVAEIEQTIADAAEAHPEFEGKTFAYVYVSEPGALNVYVAGDPRVELLRGLGMELAPGVADLETSPGTFTADISMEKAELLNDADVVLTWFNDKAQQQQVESDPVFQQIPAVQRGSYVAVMDRSVGFSVSTVTALSLPWGLERFLPTLSEAVKKS